MSESAEDSEKHEQDNKLSFKNVSNDKVQINSNKRIDEDKLSTATSFSSALDGKKTGSPDSASDVKNVDDSRKKVELNLASQDVTKETLPDDDSEIKDRTFKRKSSPESTENNDDDAKEIKRQRRYLSRREEKMEKQREYYSKNRERMVEKQADYYKANRQEVIARQNEYYQKNKSKITEKKRQWYQEKRGFVSNKRVVHPSLVDSISLEDSTKEGCGKIKIKHLKPIIQKFNNEANKKWKVVYDIRSAPDFTSVCKVSEPKLLQPGESKLDSLSDNENILTLPPGYTYRSKPLEASELLHVDSFVALAISKDDESLDLRYLLHKDHITLEGMRDLLHSIQSVLDIDMYDFITEKQSLFFINPTCLSNPVLKNRFCKQVSISI